jgi:hypothetical protein
MKITHILETHIHADSYQDQRIGCDQTEMYLSAEGGGLKYEFPHVDVKMATS